MTDEFGNDPAPTAEAPPGDGAGAAPVEPDEAPRRTNAGRVWVALAVATVLLILLIIFLVENDRSVTISFLGAHGHLSLAVALLIAAVVGALVTLLAGTARILQLRLEVRRHRRHAVAEHRGLHAR